MGAVIVVKRRCHPGSLVLRAFALSASDCPRLVACLPDLVVELLRRCRAGIMCGCFMGKLDRRSWCLGSWCKSSDEALPLVVVLNLGASPQGGTAKSLLCILGAGARPPWRRCQPRGLVLVQVLRGGTASWGAGASDWLLCFAPVPPIISRRDSTSASVLLAVVLLSTHPQDWLCTLLGHSVSFCSITDI